jgi:hypothetical protein
MEATQFDTKPLLRPHQIEESKSEIKTMEAQLQNPSIEDKAEVHRRLIRVRKTVESQTPRPPESGEEEGRMVRRSRQLLDEILVGMPSQEEMRKAPPGAVDKHMKWEKRNKSKILEWKNLQLRMTHGEEPEAPNLERHRPVGSSLNMDNAYIQGKRFFMPETIGKSVTFSDEQLDFLRSVNPGIADMIGLMNNDQREQVKDAIGIGLTAEPSAASIAGKRGVEKREAARKAKRVLTEEHKKKLLAGRERARAEKAAKAA